MTLPSCQSAHSAAPKSPARLSQAPRPPAPAPPPSGLWSLSTLGMPLPLRALQICLLSWNPPQRSRPDHPVERGVSSPPATYPFLSVSGNCDITLFAVAPRVGLEPARRFLSSKGRPGLPWASGDICTMPTRRPPGHSGLEPSVLRRPECWRKGIQNEDIKRENKLSPLFSPQRHFELKNKILSSVPHFL